MEPRTDYSITKTFDSCSPNLIHHEPPSAPHHEDPCVVWKLSSKLYLPVKLLLYKGVHTDHFFSSGPDSFLIQNSLCVQMSATCNISLCTNCLLCTDHMAAWGDRFHAASFTHIHKCKLHSRPSVKLGHLGFF